MQFARCIRPKSPEIKSVEFEEKTRRSNVFLPVDRCLRTIISLPRKIQDATDGEKSLGDQTAAGRANQSDQNALW